MSAVEEPSEPDAAKEAAADASSSTSHPYRWPLACAAFLVYFGFGINAASLAPLVPEITSELHINNTQMGFVLGVWQLVYIGSAVACGTLLDRVGIRRGILLAGIILALSGVLRATAHSYAALLFAVALFGIGGPLVSVGVPKLVGQWFGREERAKALGFCLAGSALGSTFALAMTHSMMMPLFHEQWRSVLMAYAGATAAMTVIWLLTTMHPALRAQERGAAAEKRPTELQTLRALLNSPAVRLVMVLSVGVFGLNHGLNAWLPEILRHSGMAATSAGYWSAVPALVGTVGPVILAYLATPERRFLILTVLLLNSAMATVMLQFDGLPLYFALVQQGISRGMLITVLMLSLMEVRAVGPKNAGAAGGLYFTAGEIGGVLGPVLIGTAYDVSGGFTLALGCITALCIGMTGIVWILKRVEVRPGATGS